MVTTTLIVLVVIAALVFTFTNGFHDTANAIATVVSTGVLRPRTAVMMAAVLNLVGAFMGTAVAKTISKDLIDPEVATQLVVLAALVGAIAWNLFTWYFGIPSSSSHALVGGLVGAAWASGGPQSILWAGVNKKVVVPLVVSPFLGFFASFVVMVAVTWMVRRARPSLINSVFRKLQLLSSAFMAWSHGTNDAQKSVGVVTLALLAGQPSSDAHAPTWVIVACALAMGGGTAMGGWGIIKTMGSKIFKLRPIHGFVAETTAATVIELCTIFGLPTSTTHCITSAIMGAGATTRLSAVSWGVTRRILVAWVLTIPASAAMSAGTWMLLSAAGI
ncbi:inorganic phosphate transporter [Deltaproteobacteria bacterium]|nr:inorganic phosphate transporter [Deltaproteobacteria bacterium]